MEATGFDGVYGIEVLEASPERARGQVAVRDGVKQPYGLVHGGVYASLGESLATLATEAANEGRAAIGHASQTSFLRPVTSGTVHATGRPRHRGRSTWVWEFDVTDEHDRLCALVRTTVLLVDPPR